MSGNFKGGVLAQDSSAFVLLAEVLAEADFSLRCTRDTGRVETLHAPAIQPCRDMR